MIHFNLHSHRGDTIDELTSLVERVSREVSTERAAFTTKFAGCRESAESELNKAGASLSGDVFTTPSLSGAPCDAPSLITEQPAINSGDSNADSERDSLASPAPRVLSPELPRFDPAYEAGVETFPGQFEGEEQ